MSNITEYNTTGNKKLKLKLTFYSDPSHGWVAVKRRVLHEMKINDLVSSWSYQKGLSIYLEEDSDAPLLFQKLDKKNIPYSINEKYTDGRSWIRDFRTYINKPNYLTIWDK